MNAEENKKFNQYLNKYAHQIEPDGVSYKITTLYDQHEENFLNKLKENDLFWLVNIVTTAYAQGEAVGLIQSMPGTTDTGLFDREPKLASKRLKYHCEQMNIDSSIRYEKLDAYLNDPDFIEAFEAYLDKHLLNAVLMVGLNGTNRAKTSDPEQNPLAQDVMKGWLQKIRDNAQITSQNNVINVGEVGENGTYRTLKKAVKEGLKRIKPIYADSDLIAICGRDVIPDERIDNNKDGLEGQFGTT